MTLLRPPAERPLETEVGDPPEVLFKEARQRRRRRWAIGVAAVVLAASGAWVGYGASGNGGQVPRPEATTPPRQGAGPTGPATRAPSPAPSTSPPSLQTVAFFNPTLGYGLFRQTQGGFCEVAVAETTDGGSHFAVPVPVAPCGRSFTLAGLAFDDHGDGFVYGASLFVTHNGGTSWQPDPQPGQVVSVEALGTSIWMLEADCAQPVSQTHPQRCPLQVYESTDGGRTWTPSPTPPASASVTGRIGRGWGSLIRVSTTAAYVVAAPPTPTSAPNRTTPGTVPLSFTNNGGRTWVQRSIPCGADAQRAILSAAPSGTLFAVCGWYTQVGGQQRKAVLVSTDGGASWSKQATCGGPPFTAPPCSLALGNLGVVDAVSSSTAYEIGSRGPLLETTDGGGEWTADQVTGEAGGSGGATAIFFGPSDGVAFTTHHLWHTANASQGWSQTSPSVHQAPLPLLRRGHLDVATLPAPLKAAARRVQAKTSVPFEAPFTVPPSLSATAKVTGNQYAVSLFECPHLLGFDAPAVGTGACGGVGQKFGSFGGERQASASAARAVVRKDVARPPGCPTGRTLTRHRAPTGDVAEVGVAGTGSVCAFTWEQGRWTVEVVGAVTSHEVTTAVLTPMEQLTHWSALPGTAGVLIMDKTADGVHVLARWSQGSTVYDVRVSTAVTYPTLTGALPLISDLTPVSPK